jgi:2-iminoacetate synthase
MQYHDYMQIIESDIMDKTLRLTYDYDYGKFTIDDVRNALNKDTLNFRDFGALLSPAAQGFIEEIARRSKADTRRNFGNSVSLYTPLYISNYCDNTCTYCGFNRCKEIKRGKLSLEEIHSEFKAIAETGLEEILLLTGESRSESSLEYIGEAVKAAKEYFTTISLEVYPLNTDEYAYLNRQGADFVSVYQETYIPQIYKSYHKDGAKSVYPYRFNAQERAVAGGMRGVSFGALLGLGDFRTDSFACGIHAYLLQKKYPHAQISFSVPRIHDASIPVSEMNILQVILAYRIFMPFALINISTRERAGFRDNVIALAANKISAGVKVGVGGHSFAQKGDEQFVICDTRTVEQIHAAIKARNLQPVYTDYISLTGE